MMDTSERYIKSCLETAILEGEKIVQIMPYSDVNLNDVLYQGLSHCYAGYFLDYSYQNNSLTAKALNLGNVSMTEKGYLVKPVKQKSMLGNDFELCTLKKTAYLKLMHFLIQEAIRTGSFVNADGYTTFA